MEKTEKAAPASRFAVDKEAIEAAVHNAFGIEMRQALASHVSMVPGEIEQILLNFKANIVKELSGTVAKDQEALADKDSRLEALEAENKKLQGGELAKKDAEIKTLTDRVAEMGQGYEAHKLASMTPAERAEANKAHQGQVVDPNPAPHLGYTTGVGTYPNLPGHGPQVKGDHVDQLVHHNVVGDPTSAATMREDAELRKTAGVRSDGTHPGQPPLHVRKPSDPDGAKEALRADQLAKDNEIKGAKTPHDQEAVHGAFHGSEGRHELGPAPGKGEVRNPNFPAKKDK